MEEKTKRRKKYHRGRRKKRKKGSILTNVILIVAIIVFCVSGFQLVKIYKGYHDGEQAYEEIIDKYVTIDNSEEGFSVDFDALKELNPDVVGWIRFDEPAIINYPVVQGTDNDKYLHKTFQGYTNTVGSIFVDAYCRGDFEARNTIVYGHRMYNGTMFNDLGEYESEEFWKKYPFFYIYTPDGREMKYQIYSAGIVKETSDIYTREFADDAAFEAFIEETKSCSNYDTGTEVTVDDKIVVLSTCTGVNDDERLVVIGKRVSVVQE